MAKEREDWLLFDQDESWFSRFTHPCVHSWEEKNTPLKMVEQTPKKGTKYKAISCFGARCQKTKKTVIYFNDGQPNSEQMWLFIIALLAIARQQAKQVLVLIWDNASWHKSARLKQWIRQYNQQAKKEGQPRLITHLLPIKSPWLNPIEPSWLHAKKQVCEPQRGLTINELKGRLADYFNTTPLFDSFKISVSN